MLLGTVINPAFSLRLGYSLTTFFRLRASGQATMELAALLGQLRKKAGEQKFAAFAASSNLGV